MKSARSSEDGFAVVLVLTLLIPLILTAAVFQSVMVGRTVELRSEHDEEVAFLTAEAGVDDAIYRGREGTLTAGTTYTYNFSPSRFYTIQPTHLKTDGADNDGDGSIDEADEDVFQVIVTGTYRNSRRRLAAYLGPVPLMPALLAALSTQDLDVEIDLDGTPAITGVDTKMNGGPGAASPAPGLTIANPGTVAHLQSELSASEGSKITGAGSAPSLGVGPAIDMPTLVAQIRNIANVVLTSDKYASYDFGDGSAGTANIAFRDGDVRFSGNTRGAGILVVTGDLEMRGTFRFDGVILVLGEVRNSSGTASIYGSLVQGPNGDLIESKGTFNLYYSTQAIALANSISGRYVSFNGWQELSRK